MKNVELWTAAAECLKKVFNGDVSIPAYVVQAAVSIVLTPAPETKPE